MARQLRLEVPGGIYHVTARGNAKGRIYRDDQDREAFLAVLAKTKERFGFKFLAYCLMGNHYHLVMQTPRTNLSRGMQFLNGVYTQKFNRRYKRCGHLLQGRFGAVLVEADSHLLEVIRYVVRNPLKARLCDQLEDWPWSSHRAVLAIETSAIVSVNELLAHFGETAVSARERYNTFVNMAQASAPLTEGKVIAGSDQFRNRHLAQAIAIDEIPRDQWLVSRPPLLELLRANDDGEAIAAAHRHGYAFAEIARALGCHYSTVSRRLKRWEMQGNARCKI